MRNVFAMAIPLVLLAACVGGTADVQTEADAFLRS